jgi:hypothetical protein
MIGDTFRVAVIAALHGQETVNTFFYSQTGGAGLENLALAQTLANGILASAWWPFYLSAHSDEWTAVRFEIAQVSNTGPGNNLLSPTWEIDITDADGTVVSSSLPSSMAFVIRRRTNLPGRRGYGRIYLCGFPVAWEVDSAVNTGLAAFTTFWTGFAANINADLISGAITWSPRHYAPSLGAVRAQVIRQWAYDSVLRNQRRRQVGVGI